MMNLSGRTLGEFVLLEEIGSGGFATVYRCQQPLLGREVVVKVLHEERCLSDSEQKRFLLEAQLASKLSHSGAAHIYAFGVEPDGVRWIAMERIRGMTLRAYLKKHGAMALEKFVPFFEHVAKTLHDAHEQGIVHRDVKPSNIMVIEQDGQILSKLLDFGIAKGPSESLPNWPEGSLGEGIEHAGAQEIKAAVAAVGASPARSAASGDTQTDSETPDPSPPRRRLTRPGVAMGSCPYMSPEQWKNPASVSPASDIYSLSVVAYEALTGAPPFVGETRDAFRLAHLKAEPPPLGEDILAGIDRAVRRSLAKSPSDRHANALDWAAELRTELAASPRQQLRASSQQWADSGRARGLLWGKDVVSTFDRWALRSRSLVLDDLESSFLAASRRRVQRAVWLRRVLGALTMAVVFGVFQFRSAWRTREAQDHARAAEQQAQFAEQLVTQAEVEQGRQALALHEDMGDARAHLTAGYRRGARTSEVEFMLARSIEPQLAELNVFPAIGGRVWSAALAPDGQHVVVTDDKGACIWEIASHRCVHVLYHSGDAVYDAIYTAHGDRIITAGGDGTVGIWNASDGSVVRMLRHTRKPRFYLVAVSPDEKHVAAIDVNGDEVSVWDTLTGALKTLPNGGSNYPGLAFSPDGRWLASIGTDVATIFDARTWARVRAIPHARRFAFDPTGARIATGSPAGDASIWEVSTGKRVNHLREIGDSVERVAFSPNGKLVATAGSDGSEQLWEIPSGALLSQFNARHAKPLALEFDRASEHVLMAGADGSVVVSAVTSGMPVAVLEGARSVVRVAHFDLDGRHIVGASWDGTARLWDAHATHLRWGTRAAGSDCRTSPDTDRRFVAIACKGSPTWIWDTTEQRMIAELPAVTPVEGDWRFAFPAVSPAGDLAAIAHYNTVELYELPGGRRTRVVSHSAAVSAVAFSGRHDLVSGDVRGGVQLTLDGADPIALATPSDSPGKNGIDVVNFAPDGRIATVDEARRLRVYDAARATLLSTLVTPDRVMSLRFSRGSDRLLTIPERASSTQLGQAAKPSLWDLDHYKMIGDLSGHLGQVFGARFLDSGEILSAGGDGTARLWTAKGQLIRTYHGPGRFLADAVVSPDGRVVVAGCGDGTLRFWDKDSGRWIWTMPAHPSPVMGLRWEGDGLVTFGFLGEMSRWKLTPSRSVIAASVKPAIVSQ